MERVALFRGTGLAPPGHKMVCLHFENHSAIRNYMVEARTFRRALPHDPEPGRERQTAWNQGTFWAGLPRHAAVISQTRAFCLVAPKSRRQLLCS